MTTLQSSEQLRGGDAAAVAEGGVVELRIHGVSGTPPEGMLDDEHPEHVAGDDTGRIYRRRRRISVHGYRPRVVEAYHWGRYTSGSASRALWLLLLPFAVLNMARFALLIDKRRSRLTWFADAVLRLLGLVLTLALVVTTCYLAWDVTARQCAVGACPDVPGWTGWFKGRNEGIRILVAAIAPAVIVTLVWLFGRRPPEYEPQRDMWVHDATDQLGDPAFWFGSSTSSRQRAAHVWASCAVIGLLALATVGDREAWRADVPWWVNGVYLGLGACCVVGGVTALLMVAIDRQPWTAEQQRRTDSVDPAHQSAHSRPRRFATWLLRNDSQPKPDAFHRDAVRIPGWQTAMRWFMAAVAGACVIFASLAIDRVHPGPRAGSRTFEVAVAVIGALAGLLLLGLLILCWRMRRTEGGRQLLYGAIGETPIPRAFRPYFHGYGAWILAALAMTFGFGFSTAAVFWLANLLGEPSQPGIDAVGGIEIAAGYWTSATLWGALVTLLIVLALPLAAWVLRRLWGLVLGLVVAAVCLVGIGVYVASRGNVLSDGAEWFLGAAGLVLLAAAAVLIDGTDGFFDKVSADYSPSEAFEGTRRVVRSWRIAMSRYRYHHVVGAVAALGGSSALVWAGACFWTGITGSPPAMPKDREKVAATIDGLTTIGVLTVSALAVALVALGVASWRRPKVRTTVGILWDMMSFWPRVSHPLCPLPYGGRAVRAVVKRTSDLAMQEFDVDMWPDHIGPQPQERFSTVVISGHSQGSVIALAACDWLRRTSAACLPQVCLVTFGSQLQFIYARMFPYYVGFAVQQQIYASLGGRWRNVYRWTDPLGGPVLSWPRDVISADQRTGPSKNQKFGPSVDRWMTMACSPSCPGHEGDAEIATTSYGKQDFRRWRIGPDVRLRDPGMVAESPFLPRLPAKGHGDYPCDPGFNEVVSALADGGLGLAPCPPSNDGPMERPREVAEMARARSEDGTELSGQPQAQSRERESRVGSG